MNLLIIEFYFIKNDLLYYLGFNSDLHLQFNFTSPDFSLTFFTGWKISFSFDKI
jgi:hypothetical protein